MGESLKSEVQKVERVESEPTVNILGNYDAALQAIAEVEGDGWKNNQSADSGYSLASALKNLREERARSPIGDNPHRYAGGLTFIVYGQGGINRYIIRGDGSVWLHRGFIDKSLGKQGQEELFKKVQDLGIGLFGG